MNQIKKARNMKNMSQSELARRLNITQQAISYYEKGLRIPEKEIWDDLSYVLDVPVEFLKGEINDPEGWKLWEDTTGYSRKQIEAEISRMEKANHIIGDSTNIQNVIGQAVANLDGYGNTDKGILDHTASTLGVIMDNLSDQYKDPVKLKKLESDPNSSIRIIPANTSTSELIYDDLSPEAYEKAMDILQKARTDLRKVSLELDLN